MKKAVLKTVIIDDEVQAINLLTELVKTIPEISVIDTFTDPVKALIEAKILAPDLLFLDIQMPKMSGFEFLRGIRNGGLNPGVIFVTAYDQFALEAIHNEAFDYLLKPVSPDELKNSVQRLINRSGEHEENISIDQLLKKLPSTKLQFPDRHGVTFLAADEIIYIAAEGNYCNVVTKTKSIMVTRQLGELEDLLTPLGFLRLGRSNLINPVFLSRIDRKQHLCILTYNDITHELSVSEEALKNGKWYE